VGYQARSNKRRPANHRQRHAGELGKAFAVVNVRDWTLTIPRLIWQTK
jgi:hypothetical protein